MKKNDNNNNNRNLIITLYWVMGRLARRYSFVPQILSACLEDCCEVVREPSMSGAGARRVSASAMIPSGQVSHVIRTLVDSEVPLHTVTVRQPWGGEIDLVAILRNKTLQLKFPQTLCKRIISWELNTTFKVLLQIRKCDH